MAVSQEFYLKTIILIYAAEILTGSEKSFKDFVIEEFEEHKEKLLNDKERNELISGIVENEDLKNYLIQITSP